MVCCARRVVKTAEPILESGNRSDIGSSTVEERAEEFGRIANVLEYYSDPVSLLRRFPHKLAAAFESTLVKPLQSLIGKERRWLGQPLDRPTVAVSNKSNDPDLTAIIAAAR
jgi:hypothetical protein